MKTTIVFVICCLGSLSVALETIYVGDFIHPPSAASNPPYFAPQGILFDSFGGSMTNGKGIQMKFVNGTRSDFTGVLLIKKTDGTYRTIDLPFNCSLYASTTFNGEVFVCGNKIFTLGPGDSIQNLQELSFMVTAFSNNSVLTHFSFGNGLKIWSNLPENSNWTLASSTGSDFNFIGQVYPNHAITALFQGTTIKLYQRLDLTWNLVELVDINFTGETNVNPPILWNGGDTIIAGWRAEEVGFNTLKGEIKIFRKVSGSWSLSKVITSTDLGLAAPGGLGVRLLLIDENTVLVHAVDGYNRTRTLTGGSSFALEKINDDWVVTTKFVQQNNKESYLMGAMSYDKSDGRLYFTACRTVFQGRLSGRECGIKYAVWNRA